MELQTLLYKHKSILTYKHPQQTTHTTAPSWPTNPAARTEKRSGFIVLFTTEAYVEHDRPLTFIPGIFSSQPDYGCEYARPESMRATS